MIKFRPHIAYKITEVLVSALSGWLKLARSKSTYESYRKEIWLNLKYDSSRELLQRKFKWEGKNCPGNIEQNLLHSIYWCKYCFCCTNCTA